MKGRPIGFAVLAFALLAPVAGFAESQKEAEQEMALAQEALDHNDYPTALQHFSAAQTLLPQASGPLLGLGLTYAAIDRCQEAVPLLSEYRLRKGSSASPKAERAINDCQHKPSNGTLVLETRPTGVDVYQDIKGQPLLGKTPLVADLPVGRHTLLLRKQGFLLNTVTVQIRPGQETRELTGLRAEPGSRAEPTVATAAPPRVEEPKTPPPPTRVEAQLLATPPVATPSKPSRTGLWVGLGIGIGIVVVVGVTVGVVLGTRKNPTEFPLIQFQATQ